MISVFPFQYYYLVRFDVLSLFVEVLRELLELLVAELRELLELLLVVVPRLPVEVDVPLELLLPVVALPRVEVLALLLFVSPVVTGVILFVVFLELELLVVVADPRLLLFELFVVALPRLLLELLLLVALERLFVPSSVLSVGVSLLLSLRPEVLALPRPLLLELFAVLRLVVPALPALLRISPVRSLPLLLFTAVPRVPEVTRLVLGMYS